ncbi:putative oxidoreductase C736.13 [Rhizoctonia solani AG-1 IB]|uniref:Putative oxidoreductase C736.13 n=1 Tax=Thanatephorus cucumeris (strain AG1-IB / isolate 7/3/14) TaxID=1108050 RepID=M5CA99_THACB|nr:putative oxidoreductase C736.13 [Rhizoctonia solani AG-1 IB]
MGNIFSQAFPPKSLFSVEQIPDLAGQVIVVTGHVLNNMALLNKNAKVYLAARSKSRADDAIEWLKTETNGKAPIFLKLDLGSLDSVRKAAEEFKSKEQELHVLFNNAGVLMPPVEQRTANGYDLQFGTNVLGHYFFTILLLPTLIHTAKNSPLAHGHARVINTSSSMVYFVPKEGIAWETLGTDMSSIAACKKLGANGLYAQSKLALRRPGDYVELTESRESANRPSAPSTMVVFEDYKPRSLSRELRSSHSVVVWHFAGWSKP